MLPESIFKMVEFRQEFLDLTFVQDFCQAVLENLDLIIIKIELSLPLLVLKMNILVKDGFGLHTIYGVNR